MTEHLVANKRPLENDDNDSEQDSVDNSTKRLKLLTQSLPPSQNASEETNVRNWNLLPAVVYELLALIKKSEKPDTDDEVCDAYQKKITEDIKDEIKILPNSICQNIISDIETKNENLEKSDEIVEIFGEKSDLKLVNLQEPDKLLSVEDSVKNLEDINLSADKIEIIKLQKEKTLNTKTTVINVVNVQEEDSIKDETNEIVDITKISTLAENFSNNSVENNLSKIDNLIRLSKRQQLFELLTNCCFNGISKIPTTKPCPCYCKCCLSISNIPKDQLAVNNLFTSTDYSNLTNCDPNYKLISSDMYNSEIPASDCSVCAKNDCCCVNNMNSKCLEKKPRTIEMSKSIWINDLVSLIRKNETLKDCK